MPGSPRLPDTPDPQSGDKRKRDNQETPDCLKKLRGNSSNHRSAFTPYTPSPSVATPVTTEETTGFAPIDKPVYNKLTDLEIFKREFHYYKSKNLPNDKAFGKAFVKDISKNKECVRYVNFVRVENLYSRSFALKGNAR